MVPWKTQVKLSSAKESFPATSVPRNVPETRDAVAAAPEASDHNWLRSQPSPTFASIEKWRSKDAPTALEKVARGSPAPECPAKRCCGRPGAWHRRPSIITIGFGLNHGPPLLQSNRGRSKDPPPDWKEWREVPLPQGAPQRACPNTCGGRRAVGGRQ